MAEQPTLSAGDTGEWVTYLQEMLAYHQMGSGFQDGTYCAATEYAVSTLQQHHGLPATGQCDEATWAALLGGAAPTEQGTGQSEAMPADIAVSMQVQVAAPDEQHTLEELDDLPGNARRNA
ncbi:peptidoglycan-binding domain-containing protein [Actinophytocola algeriensis]|uniref:Peptidoglycan hydrolase-like protein with peptidoglycan-binding domain n=1 Tax=Actinophytocola algeriensis TaxID=1768010 RepID=A0A7W7VDD2_9PSEU|nr:peptidoglycan-binding domain-containing protein [Actinophytocola algeriensis]MBB4905969.1 peptidoglycan hydrolase-like protein with peptidoglycan-binding domain [Actinophytocola algeriensis]MBE1472346.1 peptidoglycan hydrolase-like protein with peptidoglycan-binding domain [Actinophytocola algeriensis]